MCSNIPCYLQNNLTQFVKTNSKWIFKILHDLDIQKLNFGSLKKNGYNFAWHFFWHHISFKWSWFQASNWPIYLQKFQIKFLQLWHHQGCVMKKFILRTQQLISKDTVLPDFFVYTRCWGTPQNTAKSLQKIPKLHHNSSYKCPSW